MTTLLEQSLTINRLLREMEAEYAQRPICQLCRPNDPCVWHRAQVEQKPTAPPPRSIGGARDYYEEKESDRSRSED